MKIPAPRLFICLILVAASATAHALALSEIELLSNLNDRLNARIRLESATQADLDSLSVSVTQKQTEGQSYVALKYDVGKDDQGAFIHITSSETIREPILQLTVEVSWTSGKLARDYSLIIDPR